MRARAQPRLRQLGYAMTGHLRLPERQQRRHLGPAALDRVGTAGMKGAARGRIERRRQLALERDALASLARIERRRAGEQRAGVRMGGSMEDSFLGTVFDRLAEI